MTKMNRQDMLFWAAFSALAVVALVLAVLLLKPKFMAMRQASPGTADNNAPSAPAPAADQNPDDRAQVLNTPPKDAATSTKEAHFALVRKLAQDTSSLDLTGCAPNPLVSQVHAGTNLIVTNKDGTPHQLQINPEHLYTVPGNGRLEVKVDFGYGPGSYGYGCDNSARAVGIFWVVP